MGNATIRLSCRECSRDDKDMITPEELPRCSAEGWTEIVEVQTFEQACQTFDNPDDAPPGFDVTAWYTHLGLCPDCQDDE